MWDERRKKNKRVSDLFIFIQLFSIYVSMMPIEYNQSWRSFQLLFCWLKIIIYFWTATYVCISWTTTTWENDTTCTYIKERLFVCVVKLISRFYILTCAGTWGITVSKMKMNKFGTDSLKLPVHPNAKRIGSQKIQKLANTYQMSSLPWCWGNKCIVFIYFWKSIGTKSRIIECKCNDS